MDVRKNRGWEKCQRSSIGPTITRRGVIQNLVVLIDPRLNEHKIGHKRRDRAFEDRTVATNHILGEDLRFVELIDN
jgi:hypothetical protein